MTDQATDQARATAMRAALILLLAVLASPGHAGRPLVSEDAGALERSQRLVGNRPAAERLRHSLSLLNGFLTLPLNDALRMHANLGWIHDRVKNQGSTRWALERSGWQPGVDRMGEALVTDRGRSPWLQTGLRWSAISDRLFVDGSVGVQTSGQRPVNLTLGLKAAF